MKDPTCGCCEGTEKRTPLATANRPGLDALSYRVGTHGTFFESMQAALTSHRLEDGRRPLQQLKTRDPADPTLALLDAWSTVADVLTFYQERIANEGYLRTATERRSILELARLVGYRLKPGVAAGVFLAFTLEDGFEIEIPAGTLARSLPGPGELPQPFETDQPLQARTAWNALAPRQTHPLYLRFEPQFPATRRLYLEGTATDLEVNDALLLVRGNEALPYTVHSVETDSEADRTTLSYGPYVAQIAATKKAAPGLSLSTAGDEVPGPPLTRLAEAVRALRRDPSLQPPNRYRLARPPRLTYSASADLGPRLLTRFDPRLSDTLYAAYANAPVADQSADQQPHLETLRIKTAPFGNNAPLDLVYDDNVLAGRREWDLAEFSSSLDLALSSLDPDLTLGDLFHNGFDIGANEFPPLHLQISIADEVGTMQPLQLVLGDLRQPAPDKPVYQRAYTMGRTTIRVQAIYEGDATSWSISQISVVIESDSRQRTIVVRERSPVVTVAAAASGYGSYLEVTVTGLNSDTVQISAGQTLSEAVPAENRRFSVTLNNDATLLRASLEESSFAVSDRALSLLSLDAVYDGITAGGRVLVDRPDADPELYRVAQVRTLSRAAYGITGKVTQLLLDRPWLSTQDISLSLLRGTTVYARNEVLQLAEAPIERDVFGDEIELDGLYEALEAGRWVVVQGERSDVRDGNGRLIEGIEASELAMIAGVSHELQTVTDIYGNVKELPGDTLHTRLILAEGMAYHYRRGSVKINANVVKASHGETQREILGNGDAARTLQTFTLGRSPLTHTAAATPEGVESTLAVRVNDILWPEQKTLLYLDGTQRGYQTKRDDEGNTSLIFGDGKHGTRLPGGIENVTAVYRAGIGKSGNVEAGKISVLGSRPLGVKGVFNPQRASGGADAESRDQARRNAPLGVLALDRLVSVPDYADFARTFAGIGKARAASLTDGRRTLLHLTIAGADDAPIEARSDLYRNLLLALNRFGDPRLPLQVATREVLFLFISARVKLLEEYLWEKVEPKIRAVLLDRFGFERRELGQGLLLSNVISVIQTIEGVDYVDLDLLDGVSESDAEDPAVLARKLESLATALVSPSTAGNRCATRPTQHLRVETARIDPAASDPSRRIRPAQLAYLNPQLLDTLILTEVQP